MRVVHLCTQDRSGGAARAANRLHAGLRANGYDSHMVVHRRETDDPTVHPPRSSPERLLSSLCMRLDDLPLQLYPDRDQAPYNLAWVPGPASGRMRRLQPDVVHLHWLGGGFVGLSSLAMLDCPVIWTLHDMWAFTGGCHYSAGCKRYQDKCGACPRLASGWNRDLSRWSWSRKARALRSMNPVVVAPSRWLGSRANRSSLVGDQRIEVVPYGLDLGTFQPLDRQQSRTALDLPADAFLVLFGAVNPEDDPRKGADLLRESLEHLAQQRTSGLELVVCGEIEEGHTVDFPFPTHRLGYLDDERSLVRAYDAADLFVIPSRQDNLPNTVAEALACGTPVAGWEVGGVPEMVEAGDSGHLVPFGETAELAETIARVAGEPEEVRVKKSKAARRTAKGRFSLDRQVQRYAELYQEMLDWRGS